MFSVSSPASTHTKRNAYDSRLKGWMRRFRGVLTQYLVGWVHSQKNREQKAPYFLFGAAEESRTLDLNLGKVALYQLSYCRAEQSRHYRRHEEYVNICFYFSALLFAISGQAMRR